MPGAVIGDTVGSIWLIKDRELTDYKAIQYWRNSSSLNSTMFAVVRTNNLSLV